MNQMLAPFTAKNRSLCSGAVDASGTETLWSAQEAVTDESRPDPALMRRAFGAYLRAQHAPPHDRRLLKGVLARVCA